uniref:Uncharacterized protein n=1 Tax=Takifugu rubripes TaxID=31033 RepID=H2STL5_TAKRU
VPSSDARHFPQPFVGLPGKLLRVPAAHHTSAALGDSDDVDRLVLVEDAGHGHDASPQPHLEMTAESSTFFLLLYLGARKGQIQPRTAAAWVQLTEFTPVSIKSAFALVAQVLCKDAFEGTQAVDRLDVPHHPDHDDRRGFNNGDCFYLLSPVAHTEANALHLPQRVGHASLISQESGEVHRTPGIVFGPRTHPAPVLLAALVWQEACVSMARGVELAM